MGQFRELCEKLRCWHRHRCLVQLYVDVFSSSIRDRVEWAITRLSQGKVTVTEESAMISNCALSEVLRHRAPHNIFSLPHNIIMSIVLPGETVPAQHVNLKLGPGLQQLSNAEGSTSVVSTRAGELQHSANGSKWWVESNARRVSVFILFCHVTVQIMCMIS